MPAESSVKSHIASVSHDAPISNPRDDLLQRAEFSKQLADAIMQVNAREGFVIALNGAWGCGKTSVINLVRHQLAQDIQNKRLVITEFRPWWFSGQEQLIHQFFRHLWAVFRKKDMPAGLQNIGDAFECIGNIFDKLSGLPNIPGTAGVGSRIFQVLHYTLSSSARARQLDLDGWREKVVTQLRAQEARLLIIIDDIDRPAADEMQQMFQVVKAVGNFPNTIYLLSFDTVTVERALEKVQSGSGRDYLEKIVQLPFDLPLPGTATLHRLFSKQLDDVLRGTPNHLWKMGDWYQLFWDSIAPYLKSIRDVKRLINRLRATYPSVCGEVNGPEFIAFQTLYLFEPAIVEYVRDNKQMFVGASSRASDEHVSPHDAAAAADKILMELRPANRAAVDETLRHLFPKWASRTQRWGGYTSDWAHEWRKERRIRHAEVFDLYFNLQIPLGDIGAAEIQEILDEAPEPAAFAAQLRRLAGEQRPDGLTRVHVFLDKMQDYTDERIPANHIVPILRALFVVGDELFIETDVTGIFASMGNSLLISRIIYQLTRRLKTQQERFDAVRPALEEGTALYTVVHYVAIRGQEHGKFRNKDPLDPEASRSVSAQQLAALEAIALAKIRTAAADGSLLRAPHPISILYAWKEWADPAEVQQFASALIEQDSGFVALAVGVAGKTRTESESEVRVWTTVDPKTLIAFTGTTLEELEKRAAAILATGTVQLNDKQREVLQVLLDNIQRPKDEWGDPLERRRP